MSIKESAKEPVAYFRILEYESTFLDTAVAMILEECGLKVKSGTKVLVKPNLVSSKNPLACTHPNVTLSLCRYLKDCGAQITVADSPGYGSAAQVSKAIGMTTGLAELGLKPKGLGKPVKLELSFGKSIGISRDALETDMIINVPKLKAHSQFMVTGAVKNLFGTVVGFRKALAHTRFGENPGFMEKMIIEVNKAMPVSFNLMDAIYPMHKTGPISGKPYTMSLLAGSCNQYALDTSIYMLLGLSPNKILLWKESARQKIFGYHPDHIKYVIEPPDNFDTTDFIIPEKLSPMEFEAVRFVKGRLKSVFSRFI
ncbi:DUF362 domain-containing protein [Maridesulfovibrio hydrothermalis]|uniref:DUF362 domain-containing protein n=1 Tax=Maridesulfovibrio hydrothermalis AM13 = DSM 14728 TaxID=1121451 RepID=L0REX6_9BACT|nr:DUF362 domain-containing protein [Maridesulfovibrio hydrothermalis]CCO25309.1 conserved protein of unknown function [Maridesulfovibrio hydrothermalis AM13 = DSM 14728]